MGELRSTIENSCPTLYVQDEGVIFQNGESRESYGKYRISYSVRGVENSGERDDQSSGAFYYLNLLLQDTGRNLHFADDTFISNRIKPEYLTIYRQGRVSFEARVPVDEQDYDQIVLSHFTRVIKLLSKNLIFMSHPFGKKHQPAAYWRVLARPFPCENTCFCALTTRSIFSPTKEQLAAFVHPRARECFFMSYKFAVKGF